MTTPHFLQSIHEIKLASNHNPIFITPEEITNLIYKSRENNMVLIGILNVDFTVFKNDAFAETERKLQIDSTSQFKKILEIQGKEPYENKQSLVISTLQSNIDKNIVKFVFDKALMQKTTNKIQNLYVDFGDGQSNCVISNAQIVQRELTYNFSTNGLKTITYYGNYQNGQTFRTYSNVYIRVSTNTETPQVNRFRVDETFTPYVGDVYAYIFAAQPQDILFSDTRAELEFSIYYATNNNSKKLKKPIIITDGIDYTDSNGDELRSCSKIYNESLKIKRESNDTENENLGERLRNQGYDVVIVNFPVTKMAEYRKERIEWAGPGWNPWSGTPISWNTGIMDTITIYREGGNDYIQRNAKGIKQLLKMVNDSLQTNNSAEKLVLVGPSMGGLVTRWALKELENEGYNHNTRLWVSFDSPHQGANIPMGIQFLAQYNNEYDQLKKLKAPAPKQMLVHHYLSENNNTVYQGAPGFRERFKNELLDMGYPNPTNDITKVRKIALVNGTSTGISENTPGAKIINIHSWMASFPWGNILNGDIYFTNNSGNYKVFNFDFSSSAENAGYDDWNKWVNTYQNIGSYDTAPGCKFSIDLVPDPEDEFWDWDWGGPAHIIRIDKSFTQYFNHFTFMPTKSTLDFQGNTLLREPFCDRNLVISGETPFDAYYSPDTNEEHVALNTLNVQWLLNELNGVTDQQPNTCPVTSIAIVGISKLCNSQIRTYTLNPNYLQNVIWSTTNLNILSSNNQQITVQYANPLLRSGTINASYQNLATSKTVRCFPFLFNIRYNENLNVELTLEDKPNELPLSEQGITNVQWELTSGNSQILNYSNENAVLSDTNFTGKVTLTNEDGETVTEYFFWPDPDKCKAIVKVGTDKYQVIDRCNNNEIVDVLAEKELYSAYGYKLSDLPLINQELELNTGNSGDIQLIRVNTGDEELTKRIIKD
jgi:hypothetical protein